MIHNRVAQLDRYRDTIPRVKDIMDYLKTHDLEHMNSGKYSIDGDSLYVLISDITTQDPRERMWESHFRYADLQIPVKGVERYGYVTGREDLKEISCDREKDICFWEGESNFTSWSVAEPTDFVYFHTEEVHKPCCSLQQPDKVKKAVFKILI